PRSAPAEAAMPGDTQPGHLNRPGASTDTSRSLLGTLPYRGVVTTGCPARTGAGDRWGLDQFDAPRNYYTCRYYVVKVQVRIIQRSRAAGFGHADRVVHRPRA